MQCFLFAQVHSSETGEGFEVGADVERFSSRAKAKAWKLFQRLIAIDLKFPRAISKALKMFRTRE